MVARSVKCVLLDVLNGKKNTASKDNVALSNANISNKDSGQFVIKVNLARGGPPYS